MFPRLWETSASRVAAGVLQLSNWKAELWKPLLRTWTQLREHVEQGDISLDEARGHFEGVDDADVRQELSIMHQSTADDEHSGSNSGWVTKRHEQIINIRKVDRNVGKGRVRLQPCALDRRLYPSLLHAIVT